MNELKERKTPLREALERRKQIELPSNFNYRMMESIRLEANKQRRRRKHIVWAILFSTCLSLIGLAIFFIVFYLGINPKEYLPQVELQKVDSELFGFYAYISCLVLLLLAGDFWLRQRRRKSEEK